MIYRFATLAMILLAGSACVRLEVLTTVSEDVPVSFSTYGMRPLGAKAGSSYVASGSNFAVGAVMGVYGFYHDNSTWEADSTAGTNIPDFMYNQAVTKDNAGWEYSPVKYWPNEYGSNAVNGDVDRLSFWAYYPHNASGLTFPAYTNTASSLPRAHFIVDSDISDQVDLMFSDLQKNLYKNDAAGHGHVSDGEVLFTFRHALSLVQFEVTTNSGSLPEGSVVDISSISLTNVNSAGDCLNPLAPVTRDEDAAAYWTSVGTPVTITLSSGSGSDSNLILMPQTLVQEGSTGHSATKLTISFSIGFPAADDPTATITYGPTTVERYLWSDVASPAYGIKRWLPGRKYVYGVVIGLEEIEFSEVFTETWTLQSETNL